jgi:hypothetical protein
MPATPPPTTITEPRFFESVIHSVQTSIDEGENRRDVFLEPLLGLGQVEGDGHQLAEEEDGDFDFSAQFARRLELPHVEVGVAERAGDGNGVGPRFLGADEDFRDEVDGDIVCAHGHARAAAVGLPGPVNRLGTEGLDEAVHAGGIFGIVELDGRGRARE